jgi:hypothetical protein
LAWYVLVDVEVNPLCVAPAYEFGKDGIANHLGVECAARILGLSRCFFALPVVTTEVPEVLRVQNILLLGRV